MLPLLVWIPVFTSLVLGSIYLFLADARPRSKLAVAVIFVVAVVLQFFSRHALAGLLLQTALAFYLAAWRRMDASA